MVTNVDIMSDLRFLKRFTDTITPPFCPEILDIDESLVDTPWLPVPVPKIEPDDWELFWSLWEKEKVLAGQYSNIWEGMYIWSNPALTPHQLYYDYPKVSIRGLKDWSNYFPKMFQQINDAMPFSTIKKISLALNTKSVPIHIDATYTYYPWPNTMRVMLWDSNDKPTFYLSRWPEHSFAEPIIKSPAPILNSTYFLDTVDERDKIFVDLPTDTNTFVYNNGAFLHGADLAKPKIIMLIWGEPDPIKWKQRLIEIKKSYDK